MLWLRLGLVLMVWCTIKIDSLTMELSRLTASPWSCQDWWPDHGIVKIDSITMESLLGPTSLSNFASRNLHVRKGSGPSGICFTILEPKQLRVDLVPAWVWTGGNLKQSMTLWKFVREILTKRSRGRLLGSNMLTAHNLSPARVEGLTSSDTNQSGRHRCRAMKVTGSNSSWCWVVTAYSQGYFSPSFLNQSLLNCG